MAKSRPPLFEHADLSGQSFDQQELSRAVFDHCTLVGCSFRGADLTDATFSHCNAFSPDTDESVDFAFAILREARFEHCDLTAGDFSNTRSYDLQFHHCQIQGVDLTGSDFMLPVGSRSQLAAFTMKGCNFAYGNLSNTFLKGCNFVECRMIEAAIHNCVLDDATFTGSDLSNISGTAVSLKGADLREAIFNNLDPRKIDMTGARITPAQTLWLLEPLGVIVEPD
ncbi:MAG: pentapeptide repeat-containing protein [Pseudomonadales bacterium]